MKTLIINGSPRKQGDSVTLINEMLKYLNGDVKIVNTYFDDISPCNDCRYCWKNDGCIIDDEMQIVYQLLDEVDNIIIASPIYFSELTGMLLNFASRLQCFYARRCIQKDSAFKLKKKNAVLILVGGGDGGPEPAMARANLIFRHINAVPIGTIMSLKTDKIPAAADQEAMGKAREYALALNEMAE